MTGHIGAIIGIPLPARLRVTYRQMEPVQGVPVTTIINNVQPNTNFSFSVNWPGIGPNDNFVMIRATVEVIDAQGNPYDNCFAGGDLYWTHYLPCNPTPTPYAPICLPSPTPGTTTPTLTPTKTLTPTVTKTPTPTLPNKPTTTVSPTPEACFTENMLVSLPNGQKVIIKDVKEGDKVLAFDNQKQTFVANYIVKKYERTVDGYLVIKLENGIVLEVTQEHPILKDNLVFVKAKNLKVGDSVSTNFQGKLKLAAVISIATVNQTISVYNVETADNHTFIVEGVVVHNKVIAPTVTPKAVTFEGKYYNLNKSTTPYSFGSLQFTRTDPAVNFTWAYGKPDARAASADNFAVRWTANPVFAAGTYKFTVRADDGVRLIVDGKTVINQWKNQPATTYTANVTFTAGSHAIVMEYFENANYALAILSWTKI